MIYALVLALHIIAAFATGVVIAYALYALWRTKATSYRLCVLSLGFIAALQVFTGTVLALLSPTLLAASLSIHIFEYLGVCFVVELLLFVRMQKMRIVFPIRSVSSPVVASVLLFAAAISYGF